jgi:transcription initiation factor IIE alpha subunit
LYDCCIFRLAEKDIITPDAARLLAAVFRKGGLSERGLSEESGLPQEELQEALSELRESGVLEVYASRYFCTRKADVLLSMIEKAEEAPLRVLARAYSKA